MFYYVIQYVQRKRELLRVDLLMNAETNMQEHTQHTLYKIPQGVGKQHHIYSPVKRFSRFYTPWYDLWHLSWSIIYSTIFWIIDRHKYESNIHYSPNHLAHGGWDPLLACSVLFMLSKIILISARKLVCMELVSIRYLIVHAHFPYFDLFIKTLII